MEFDAISYVLGIIATVIGSTAVVFLSQEILEKAHEKKVIKSLFSEIQHNSKLVKSLLGKKTDYISEHWSYERMPFSKSNFENAKQTGFLYNLKSENFEKISSAYDIIYLIEQKEYSPKGTARNTFEKLDELLDEVVEETINTSGQKMNENPQKPTSSENGIDHAFDTFILLQTLVFATIFSYLVWLNKPSNLLPFIEIVRVFFVPILIIIMLWIFGHISTSQRAGILLKTMAWYWSFLSFILQALFLIAILFWDILNPGITILFVLLTVVFAMFFGALVTLKFKKTYGETYSLKIQVLSAVLSVISMVIFLFFVLTYTKNTAPTSNIILFENIVLTQRAL